METLKNVAMSLVLLLGLGLAQTAVEAKTYNSDKDWYGTPILAGFTAYEIHVLTEVLFFEGGIDTVEGRKAILGVVLARLDHPNFPNSVHEIVYGGAFSYTRDPNRTAVNVEHTAKWKMVMGEVIDELTALAEGRYKPPVDGALYYYQPHLISPPKWAGSEYYMGTVGLHRFYSWHRTADSGYTSY